MGVLTHPTDKSPAATQDLEPLEDDEEISKTAPSARPSATMAQTGEVEPRSDPSSTLLFNDDEGDEPTLRSPKRRPSRPPTGGQPAVKKPVTRTTPQLQADSGMVVKPPVYRRNVLAPGDAFESADPSRRDLAPVKPSFRELWAVNIAGSRVTIIELILAVLALVIFAGVAWLFL